MRLFSGLRVQNRRVEDDGLRVHSGRAPGRGSGFTVSDVRRVGLSSLGLFGKQSLLEFRV